MSRMPVAILVLSLGVLAPLAHSAPPSADHAQLERAIDTALLELGERDALGTAGEPVTLSRPAQLRYELGAVVDVRDAARGLRVLAITPGGAAERMGLRPGDRVLAVNGVAMNAHAEAGTMLARAVQQGGGNLHVKLARDGDPLTVAGRADAVSIPAYTLSIGHSAAAAGCGYVSTELGVPPASRGVFDALLTKIDGRSTPLTYRPNRHRLASGRHVLIVDERIRRSRIGLVEQRRIQLMRDRAVHGAYKPLVVDIKPNTVYHVGARLVEEKLDRDGIRANAYWEPVIYSVQPAPCR